MAQKNAPESSRAFDCPRSRYSERAGASHRPFWTEQWFQSKFEQLNLNNQLPETQVGLTSVGRTCLPVRGLSVGLILKEASTSTEYDRDPSGVLCLKCSAPCLSRAESNTPSEFPRDMHYCVYRGRGVHRHLELTFQRDIAGERVIVRGSHARQKGRQAGGVAWRQKYKEKRCNIIIDNMRCVK